MSGKLFCLVLVGCFFVLAMPEHATADKSSNETQNADAQFDKEVQCLILHSTWNALRDRADRWKTYEDAEVEAKKYNDLAIKAADEIGKNLCW